MFSGPDVLTGILAVLGEKLVDLVASLAVWNLDIVFHGAVVGHQGEEAVVGDVKLRALVSKFFRILLRIYARLQAGTRDARRSERPCCGWTGKDPPTSCR